MPILLNFPMWFCCVVLVQCLTVPIAWSQNADAGEPWAPVTTSTGDAVARHETSALAIDGNFYLLGGRGLKPVDVYDPETDSWVQRRDTPIVMNHFQPLYWNSKVYVVGGYDCCYPVENSLSTIYIYDPVTDEWEVGPQIPFSRRRGGAATVLYNDKFYIVGGNTLGHSGGAVAWFDEYDPATNTWTALADAPNARDHFSAVIIGTQLVAAGGRQTDQPDTFDKPVAAVDVYDLSTAKWRTLAATLPTLRAGAMVVAYGTEAIVIGGEISGTTLALRDVEALDINTGQWRTLQSMNQARHSGGAVIIGDTLHVVAGSGRKGGGLDVTAHETLDLSPLVPPPLDTDADGLTDADELNVHNTDPSNDDTDSDMLKDGDEIQEGTDPNLADTDQDGLLDGEEIISYLTSPTVADSDEDTLLDGDEVLVHLTNPKKKDTDTDGFEDADEISAGTNPLVADTDGDGVDDGAEIELGTNPLLADSDADGVSDGQEIAESWDPLNPDTDGDGIEDGEELTEGFNPSLVDSDGDGIDDATELATAGESVDSSDSGGGGAVLWLLVFVALVNRRSRLSFVG